jgi:hypothetical protein
MVHSKIKTAPEIMNLSSYATLINSLELVLLLSILLSILFDQLPKYNPRRYHGCLALAIKESLLDGHGQKELFAKDHREKIMESLCLKSARPFQGSKLKANVCSLSLDSRIFDESRRVLD